MQTGNEHAHRTTKSRIAAAGISCIVVGACALAFMSHSAYQSARIEMESIIQQSYLLASRAQKYGVVVQIDAANNRITVASQAYTEPTERVIYSVLVDENTSIVRQELQGADGAYSSLSPESPVRLGDIRPGERILVYFDRPAGTEYFLAHKVVIGNPL